MSRKLEPVRRKAAPVASRWRREGGSRFGSPRHFAVRLEPGCMEAVAAACPSEMGINTL